MLLKSNSFPFSAEIYLLNRKNEQFFINNKKMRNGVIIHNGAMKRLFSVALITLFSLQVASLQAQTVLIAMGGILGSTAGVNSQDSNGLWWNNTPSFGDASTASLITSTGATSTITFGTTSAAGGHTFSNRTNGVTVGVTSPTGTVYAAEDASAGVYWGNGTLQVGGLDTSGATRYTFTFFGTSAGTSSPANTQEFYSLSGGTTYNFVDTATTPPVYFGANINNSDTPSFEQVSFIPISSTVTISDIGQVGYYLWGTLEITAVSVPEPSVTILMGLGLLGLGFIGFRRRSRA